MFAPRTPTDIPRTAYLELTQHLLQTGSTLSPSDAVGFAIEQWIAAEKESTDPPRVPVRGYQWKCLFLPDGSTVRMCYRGQNYFADIVGDSLVYQGHCVSPRQFTMTVAGEGRNAWRDLWIRLPGERQWFPAARRRRELEQQLEQHPAPKALSQAETLEATARCMGETLKAALALLEKTQAPPKPQCERRVPRHRREEDLMIDACRDD